MKNISLPKSDYPPDRLPVALQLHQAGQLAEARAEYQQLIAAQPNRARAHFLLGLLCFQVGDNQAAIAHLEKSTQLDPAEPIFLTGLGMVQRSFKWYPQAIQSYRRALALAPADAGIHFELGLALMQVEDIPAAAAAFNRAIELDPRQPMWRLERDSLCPAIQPDAVAIAAWRDIYTQTLDNYPPGSVDLSQWLGGDSQSSVYPPFVLPYHGHNDLPLKRRFADIFTVSRPLSTPFRRPEPPYRIGFVITRSHEGIFLSLMGGILNHLTHPHLDPVVIAPHPSLPRLQAGLTNPAITWLPIPEAVIPAAETIRAAQIDLLYYWESGSDSLNYFLSFFRPAPIQVTSWGLSITTGIPQMDYFISSHLLETADAEAHYSERLVKFNTLPTCFARPKLPSPLKPRAHFDLPAAAHLYFCPQNLLKFHPDFDSLLAQILRRDPQGLVLLLEGNVPRLKEAVQQRFARAIPDVLDRLRFVPRQSFPDFLNLIALADVLLDTVHYRGGNTAHEALALGTPIVTLPGPFLRGRLTLGRYQKIGVMDTVAHSPAEYGELAVKLGTDPAYREAVKAKTLAGADAWYDDLAAGRESEQFFLDAVAAGPTQPEPAAGSAHFQQGISLFNAGHFEAALEQFSAAIEHQPGQLAAPYNRALTLRHLQRFDEAAAAYRDILRRDSHYFWAAYSLAVTLREQDKIEEALPAYQTAAALRPDYPLWRLEGETIFPAIMPGAAAIDAWRERLAQNLAAYPPGSLDLAGQVDRIADGNGLSVFNLHYHGRDNLDLLTRYAALFTVSGEVAQSPPLPSGSRLKVGFVVTANHEQIFTVVMTGFLAGLTPPNLRRSSSVPPPGWNGSKAASTRPIWPGCHCPSHCPPLFPPSKRLVST
jgi:predicted O-linked N-acetylglucosamine transferase (SPINDLY family)